jgi:signal transduction histidine kinase
MIPVIDCSRCDQAGDRYESGSIEVVTGTADVDLWQARLDRLGRFLLLPLLVVATALAVLAGGHPSSGATRFGLIVGPVAGVWSVTIATHPRPSVIAGRRLATFGFHTLLSAALVWVNPWFGVFAFTGYFFADELGLRWRRPGFVVTALILAASQSGGYPTGLSGHTVVYLAMVAVDVVAVFSMATLTNRVLEQNHERGRMIDELAETNRRLEATMAENSGLHAQLLVQAREAGVVEERQRLAGEIHDTLAQGLAGIVAQLEAAEQAGDDPDEWSRHLAQARSLARSSLTEARRSVRALRPEQLEDATLPEAISALARTWSERSTVAVEVGTNGKPARAGTDSEAAVFRAAQEALSNVAKHARASKVHLTLTYLDDALLLDVADDGVGFEPAVGSGGYGLAGMRERLARVDGTLTVESVPGLGTTINATVPLSGPACAARP